MSYLLPTLSRIFQLVRVNLYCHYFDNLIFTIVFIGKNSSLISTKDNIKIEYISEGQSSSYELTFGVELSSSSHSKMVS